MLAEVITVGFLATSAFAAQGFSPVHQFGAMLPRGDMAKRQGYSPSTHFLTHQPFFYRTLSYSYRHLDVYIWRISEVW